MASTMLTYWLQYSLLLLLDPVFSFLLDILPFYPYTKLALIASLWLNNAK